MKYLLDTCCVSEFVKKKPNPVVLDWLDEQEESDLFLSVLTLGELHKGIAKLPNTPKRSMLYRWVQQDLVSRFKGRLLSIDAEISYKWGELLGMAECRGEKLPVIDALLAATAIQHSLSVVTRNSKDLVRCDVEVVNPWV